MSEPNNDKRAVLILGMHRSGTSLLTGLIAKAGVSIGKTVMQAAEDNPKGFFENQRIVSFNEQLLSHFGLSWSSWQRLPEEWLTHLDNAWFEEAAMILTEEFGNDSTICIKDPRICRLLPFWRKLLADNGYSVCGVLATRPLGEVSASLQKRDGMGEAQANASWLRHNLDAMCGSEGLPGFHVSYQEALTDPKNTLESVSVFLGENLELTDGNFTDPKLRHHDDAEVPAWAHLLMQSCLQFPQSPNPLLEDSVYPVIAELAEMERRMTQSLADDIVSSKGLSVKEAALFAQAEEAKQHALSLSRELETGRKYIVDLEIEHREKDELIRRQEKASQESRQQFEVSLSESESYADSLKASIKEAQQYIDSLRSALDKKEADITDLRSALDKKEADITDMQAAVDDLQANIEALQREIQTREEYTQSLVNELERKESELLAAHGGLENMQEALLKAHQDLQTLHQELQTVHRELAETHQRLIDRTSELDSEMQKFKLQRRIIRMLKRVTNG